MITTDGIARSSRDGLISHHGQCGHRSRTHLMEGTGSVKIAKFVSAPHRIFQSGLRKRRRSVKESDFHGAVGDGVICPTGTVIVNHWPKRGTASADFRHPCGCHGIHFAAADHTGITGTRNGIQ